jgi:hypothetical protein
MNKENLIKKYKQYKIDSEKEQTRRNKESSVESKKRNSEMEEYFIIYGVVDHKTNLYWHGFTYKSYTVSFVDQTDRICGEYYLTPESEEEATIIKDYNMVGSRLQETINEKYNYTPFVIDGYSPIAVKSLLRRMSNWFINKERK